MTTEDDYRYMARAVQLAERGLYTTHPNPRVGCVLVKDGAVVGEGYHQRAGEPHAERLAIADAGEAARGATAYVTLEPCCHHGRTPPCTDGLIEVGVARVVAAMEDPNPLVAGQGFERLRAAGIETECGVLEAQARALNPGFVKRMTQGLPFVRCKLAMSVDGRTAMASGESKWITSAEARTDVHRLRARSEAILTGVGTVAADDPSLDVRLTPNDLPGVEVEQDVPRPMRVVVDSWLKMSPEAKMLALPGKTLVMTCSDHQREVAALEAAGAEVLVLPPRQGRVDLRAALDALAQRDVNEVLIEAGPTLAGSAMQLGLIDELVIYMAPHLMGDEARGLFHMPGLMHMRDRVQLKLVDLRQIGADVRLTYLPTSAGEK